MKSYLLLLGFLALLLAGCGEAPPAYPQRTMPEGLLDALAARKAGGRLFLAKCASCHGHPSEKRSERADFFDPPAPDFSEPRYLDIDPAYLYWRIEQGKAVEPFLSRGSVMPTWGPHLTEKQIWQLVAYVKARSQHVDP